MRSNPQPAAAGLRVRGWGHVRLAMAAWLAVGSGAWAVSPALTTVSPPGGRVGTDIELTLTGARLADARELLWYAPGIRVISLEPNTKGTAAKAMLRISPDCALGEHQLRVRTLSGITELRTFVVGPFPSTQEKEPNNENSKAQVIPGNNTIEGVITSEDVDVFKVQARKGQRLSAEVEAMRLGRVLFDASLAILDPEGRIVAQRDDSTLTLQDPFLSIIAPRDGFYHIVLREATWGGAAAFVYRMHVGSFPRPTSVFPLGGTPGDSVEFTFLGDVGGPFKQTVKLPGEWEGEFPLFGRSDGESAPSPNRIRINPLPNVIESGNNQERSSATLAGMDPPLALNGILAGPGKSDWFGFTVRAKQPMEIAVFARRLRSPLDPVLDLVDAAGKVIESNDDSAGMDSVIKHTPDEGGMMYLRIRDQLSRGGGDYTYRIEVTTPTPSVMLSIPEVARNDTQTRQAMSVPRGNRMATLINLRRTGVSGELVFEVPGLPSGVSLRAEPMPTGVDTMPWVFEAASDAGLASALVEPLVRTISDSKRVPSRYRHRLELVRGNNDQVYYATHSDRLCVAAVQEVPFRLDVDPPGIPLVRSGTLALGIRAERKAGFDDPITVKMLWNPPGITSETEITIPKGKSSAAYNISAKGDAALRTWKVVLLGSASHQGGTVWASSDLTPLPVAEPFVVGKIEPIRTHPGMSVQLKCSLEHRNPFEGRAKIRLVGLPEKATTQEREITSADREVVFDITLDPKIPTGSHKNLSCVLEIPRGKETVLQTVGSGGILRIVPPKKEGPEGKKLAAIPPAGPPIKP